MLRWFKDSLTVLWARILVVAGIVLSNLDLLGAVDLKPVLNPKWIPYYVIAIGLITEICRRRTLGKPPPEPTP